MKIWLELIGYGGTALVLLSMMMTSVSRLRWLNLGGSVLSGFYAWMCGTMPVFILNLSLAVINAVQLIRLSRQKVKEEKYETNH